MKFLLKQTGTVTSINRHTPGRVGVTLEIVEKTPEGHPRHEAIVLYVDAANQPRIGDAITLTAEVGGGVAKAEPV